LGNPRGELCKQVSSDLIGHGVNDKAVSAVPVDIRQTGPDTLGVTWNDGTEDVYNVRELRLACPCANCIDETTGAARLDPATIPADVKPVSVRSVGNYAISIVWSDGHDTGIYSFERLKELG